MNWLTAHRCSLLCAVPSRILYKSRATPGHPGASAALLMQQVDIQLKPLSGAVLGFVTHAEQWSSSCDGNRSIICIGNFCGVNINSLCFINMQRQEEKKRKKRHTTCTESVYVSSQPQQTCGMSIVAVRGQ